MSVSNIKTIETTRTIEGESYPSWRRLTVASLIVAPIFFIFCLTDLLTFLTGGGIIVHYLVDLILVFHSLVLFVKSFIGFLDYY
jgi:hypothetical protein